MEENSMKRKYMIIVLMAGALELTGCSQGLQIQQKTERPDQKIQSYQKVILRF